MHSVTINKPEGCVQLGWPGYVHVYVRTGALAWPNHLVDYLAVFLCWSEDQSREIIICLSLH